MQDAGARALANLAYNSSDGAARVTRCGGVPAVLAAMAQHPDDIRVQERPASPTTSKRSRRVHLVPGEGRDMSN